MTWQSFKFYTMKKILSFILLSAIFVSCGNRCEFTNAQFETPGCLRGMPINATFLDEVSWDIPHQNWGVEEWDKDFRAMRDMGINTVVLIRAGLGRWIAAPFESILATEDVYYPPVDLVEMFLC